MTTLLWRLLRLRALKHPPAPLRVTVLLLAVLAYGASGYLYFELPENPGLTWADSIWYSVVTMTTVGYGDFFPKSPGGRFVVAMPMMFFGIGLLGYALSLAASALVQARNKELQGMASHDFEDHLVILNFPHLAKIERLLDELRLDPTFGKRRVVIVDEHLEQLPPDRAGRNVHFVRGNPARDETLVRASVDKARYAVILSRVPGDPSSDEHSIAIALAIEGRSREIYTLVECEDFASEELLRKAGCDGILCTSRFDAHFLSHELLNPGIQEVVEELTTNLKGEQLYLTPFESKESASFAELRELCRTSGHLALGFRGKDGVQLNVADDARVRRGDAVVSVGKQRAKTF